MKPLVKNAADEGQVREAETKEKRGHERDLEDLRFLLGNPQGRRFVWRYLGVCGVFELSFNHSGAITSFNEGRRNVGLQLLKEVTEASPDALIQMMKDSKKENQ